MAKIRYIGKKERRADTMYGTGLVWHGFGDVQTCNDPGKAKLLLRHADMFELVGDGVGLQQARPAAIAEPLGTQVLGTTIHLSDRLSVQLHEVVRAALDDSQLSVEQWNALPQQERDARILAVVQRAQSFLAQAEAARAEQPAAPTPAPAAAPAVQSQPQEPGQGQQEPAGAGAGQPEGKGAAPVYRMLTDNGHQLDLTPLDKDALRRLAREKNLSVSNNAGEDTLRKRLAEAFPVPATA